MTEDRRTVPPLRSDDKPPSRASTGDGTPGLRREPTTRDILRVLERLGTRLDRVESRLDAALSGAPHRSEGLATSGHRLRPMIADDDSARRITRRPGLQTPRLKDAAPTGDRDPVVASTGDREQPIELTVPRPPVSGEAGRSDRNGGAAHSHPGRRRRSRLRLLFPLLLLGALVGGGWWVANNPGLLDSAIEATFDRVDRLLYGPEPQDHAGLQTPAPESDAAFSAATDWPPTLDAVEGDDDPSAGEPDGGVSPLDDDPIMDQAAGPAVRAAPRETVDTAALPDMADVMAEAAVLPEDAPPELHNLTRRSIDGNAEAQHDLATEFALGRHIAQDLERAVFWYRRSAESGIPNAIYNLGVLTRDGLGRDASPEEAVDLFRRAANSNHPDAQLALGRMLLDGTGTERDPVRAAGWFQAASTNGDPRGALELGRLFERGLDGAPDTAAAAGWYRVAADAGNEEAATALERLIGDLGPDVPVTSEDAPTADAVPEPVAPAHGEPVTSADGVRQIQELLAELNYDPGPADGMVGDLTRNAIEAFQEEFGLPVTGEPTQGLIEDLRHALEQE